jgi:hypothetical protein
MKTASELDIMSLIGKRMTWGDLESPVRGRSVDCKARQSRTAGCAVVRSRRTLDAHDGRVAAIVRRRSQKGRRSGKLLENPPPPQSAITSL